MIRLLILIIAIVLVLSYFQVDLRGVIESPAAKANFRFLGELAGNVWATYLAPFLRLFRS